MVLLEDHNTLPQSMLQRDWKGGRVSKTIFYTNMRI